MLGDQRLMAFVAVTDGQAARQFYEGVLQLNVLSDDDFALVLQTRNATLRIQKIDQLKAQPFTVLGWEVEDVPEVVDRLVARGVTFERFPGMDQDARAIWTAPGGAQIAWFKDPFGNVLSVSK